MREIHVNEIKKAVTELCLEANFILRCDVLKALKKAVSGEKNLMAKNILKSIIENARIAKSKRLAICQDTGMVLVDLEIGQDVALVGGDLKREVNEGVEEAYRKGYLRKSVVDDPLIRKNTNTNTPCVIFTEILEGDKLKIIVSPKGFGSENKSSIKMFKPTDSLSDIKEFILDVVRG